MKDILKLLQNNFLFKGIDSENLKKIYEETRYHINKYDKGEIIAHEEEECSTIGLILEGTIELQRIYPSGKYIVLNKLTLGDVFGEAIIFSKQENYPATVIALNQCSILYIDKVDMLELFSREKRILENFLELLSNKVLMLNSKIKNISFKNIRHRVINYILETMKLQKNSTIKLKESKESIAAALGIPRPSLSRELINLRDMGYIDFDRSNIKILDIEALEEEMFN
ncbi:cAMP-binding protein [Clostridium sulfidigenes]|uniref:cAMP-binding protein n=1 Tax=Clostridium sulfidigenes TaxID=318464 RepID=A0A084JAS9_9CLOT|nr:Crp/Fnr family transcriptional regulator [Clostridium sulfidigenes]KEZ86063.1 cAMP-binding protein [Clostridium sulfidigenes]